MIQEEQIVDCEKRLLEAIETRNISVLDELLHEKLIFNIPTGQTITKVIDIENYGSGKMTVYDISATDQIVQTNEDVSIVTVTIHLKAKYMDQIIKGKFRYLRVWKLESTERFLLYVAILMELPIRMVLFSRILAGKPNAWANILAALIKTALMITTLFIGNPTEYYCFFACIEIATTVLIFVLVVRCLREISWPLTASLSGSKIRV